MKSFVVIASLLLASSAFAARPQRVSGNFRRAEAIKAASASKQSPFVRDISNSVGYLSKGAKLPKNASVLAVEHGPVNGVRKITMVSAPHDLSKPVTVLSTRQIHRFGLITQAEAKKMALAQKSSGKITLREDGLSSHGSYDFVQTSPPPANYVPTNEGQRIKIYRDVTVTGSAVTARYYGGGWR
jgi:hypothetical protein